MDGRHFDDLARRLSSRRAALGGLLAGLLLPLDAAARGKDKHRKGKYKGKGKDKKQVKAQLESCWRAAACIPGKGANVSRCDLSGYAVFPVIDSINSNLSFANLRGVSAQRVNFTKANLSGACLVDANFTGATFANNTNLANAIFCNTTMPDGRINNSGCGAGTACCGACTEATCPQTCCDGQCVNEQTDRNNCGGCGNACPGDQICCNGACCDGCCGVDGACGVCRVFMTSTAHTGNLGGLVGADAICQGLAQNAAPPLPGTYKAWLSIDNTPNQSPASGRFRRSGQPYQLVNGTQIAANWNDLTDGIIAARIDRTESGDSFGLVQLAWTFTRPDGTAGGQDGRTVNCLAWQSGEVSQSGATGQSTSLAAGWTTAGTSNCNLDTVPSGANRRLYCVQQS